MEELFEKLSAMHPAGRAGILVLLIAAFVGGYYQLFYSDLASEKQALETQIVAAKKEKDGYETRKRQYQAYREEISDLQEQQKELLTMLPKKTDDIEQFIERIYAEIELSGLTRVSSVRDAAVQQEIAMRIPIKMSLIGTYHQINRFFKNVSEMKRIVTIGDLQLKPSDNKDAPPGTLRADFIASTFYLPEQQGAGSGTVGAGGISVGGAK